MLPRMAGLRTLQLWVHIATVQPTAFKSNPTVRAKTLTLCLFWSQTRGSCEACEGVSTVRFQVQNS
jgi:hypothetical protein